MHQTKIRKLQDQYRQGRVNTLFCGSGKRPWQGTLMKTVCHIVALSKITRMYKYNLQSWNSVFWTIRGLLLNDLTCEKEVRDPG